MKLTASGEANNSILPDGYYVSVTLAYLLKEYVHKLY